MDQAKEIRKGEELDWTTLESYLRAQLPELSGQLEVSQFHGGHANLTYLLKFEEQEFVLRRPPFGKIAPGAHDMKREYRVLSKLYQYFPPAPRAYHLCKDDAIIGSPFVLIERRKGVIVRTSIPEAFRSLENIENRLAHAMISAEASLHNVDVVNTELNTLGRPEGFVQRQIEGWSQRWNLVKTGNTTMMDEVLTMLQSNVPISQAVSIVHNDIKLDNCQFQPDNPDKVTSIFDWDMTTLGDPLMDFGSTLSYWPDDFLKQFDLPVMLEGNFPKKEYLIALYGQLTGFDLSRVHWYEAMAYWKGAIIAQQLYQRYMRGETTDIRMSKFGTTADAFAQLAIHILQEKEN